MNARYQVVVTVGTDHHRFDRLVGWIDQWAGAHLDVAVLVQRGESSAPEHAESVSMIGYDDLVAAMAAADVVVAQGGPAAIMDARGVGQLPVVVPRRGSLGEHVDDHQVRFAAWMAERGLISVAETAAELHHLLDEAIADPSSRQVAPDGGAASASVEAFAAVVDPLIGAGPQRPRLLRR